MKLVSIAIIFLSIITFRSCGEGQHPDVDLSLSPQYIEGVLHLAPVLTYNGEGPLTVTYKDSIAWIDLVEHEGDVIYEHIKGNIDINHQSILEKDNDRKGNILELEINPGIYDVHLISDFYVIESGEETERRTNYNQKIIQTIEVK
ncbi:hypothetical protein QA612_10860 [Evansella sp. AB-P1]|uniref:hypothetical protein n=1 Tax=Evansella sp. AB-P1 TaxID=3037653 RepID=UPI00241DE112|nr:hypothetical protein [Evansella sp. AB-P1]MDG5787989.1 hypothetical protein [Evansella sp. AB-P1]